MVDASHRPNFGHKFDVDVDDPPMRMRLVNLDDGSVDTDDSTAGNDAGDDDIVVESVEM